MLARHALDGHRRRDARRLGQRPVALVLGVGQPPPDLLHPRLAPLTLAGGGLLGDALQLGPRRVALLQGLLSASRRALGGLLALAQLLPQRVALAGRRRRGPRPPRRARPARCRAPPEPRRADAARRGRRRARAGRRPRRRASSSSAARPRSPLGQRPIARGPRRVALLARVGEALVVHRSIRRARDLGPRRRRRDRGARGGLRPTLALPQRHHDRRRHRQLQSRHVRRVALPRERRRPRRPSSAGHGLWSSVASSVRSPVRPVVAHDQRRTHEAHAADARPGALDLQPRLRRPPRRGSARTPGSMAPCMPATGAALPPRRVEPAGHDAVELVVAERPRAPAACALGAQCRRARSAR